MTTKVTVYAHAGWPVAVTRIYADGTKQDLPAVAPNTVQDFHVWEGCDLRISEMKMPVPNESTK